MCLMTAATTLIAACAPVPKSAEPAEPSEGLAGARALVGPGWPARPEDRLTTSGEIYLANLDSQVRTLEARQAIIRDDRGRARLALSHYQRFQVSGRLDDAERARDIATAAGGRGPALELAATTVLMGFHEFDAARAALQSATERGADPARVSEMETALDHATGADWPRSLPDAAEADDPVVEQVLAAADLFERGRADQAAAMLRAAQDAYRDSAPYTLAWIHLQQGIQFLRMGDPGHARVFFAAAHARFPQYVLAAEHLAEAELQLGHADVAAGLYEVVWQQSGNPEFLAQWSHAETARGNAAKARTLAGRAERAWASLVDRYPLMAADHGALYYLDNGQEAQALDLARTTFENRQDLSARRLLAETQMAAGHNAQACQGWRAIRAAGYAPPDLDGLARTCGSAGERWASRKP
jgi:tetratricopeptide (TPR) repeat protein